MRDDVNADSTDSTGDSVGKVDINNNFDWQINVFANSFNDGGAHFSSFYNIVNRAVVLGVFIAITTIGRSMVSISRGRGIWSRSIWRGGITISRNLGTREGSDEREESQDSECLEIN